MRQLFEEEPALKHDPRLTLYPAWLQQRVAGNRHGRAGKNGAGAIGDSSKDFAGLSLRKCGTDGQEQGSEYTDRNLP